MEAMPRRTSLADTVLPRPHVIPMPHAVRRLCPALLVALLLLPNVLASDGDPLPDSVEQLVCGSPPLASVVQDANGVTPLAGSCVGSDYVSPLFESAPCSTCTQSTLFSAVNQTLTQHVDVQRVPILPVPVPPLGPVNTPPLNEPVGTVDAFKDPLDPEFYCVRAQPSGGATVFECVNLGSVGPLLPDLPPVDLVNVSSQKLGPTPGIGPGSFGSTPPESVPSLGFDLNVGIRWDEGRLSQGLKGSVNAWEPVALLDANAVQWWAQNGDATSLDLQLVIREDGAPTQAILVHVPFAGQAAAALLKTSNGL